MSTTPSNVEVVSIEKDTYNPDYDVVFFRFKDSGKTFEFLYKRDEPLECFFLRKVVKNQVEDKLGLGSEIATLRYLSKIVDEWKFIHSLSPETQKTFGNELQDL
jgi:hypothetical protein